MIDICVFLCNTFFHLRCNTYFTESELNVCVEVDVCEMICSIESEDSLHGGSVYVCVGV